MKLIELICTSNTSH